MKKVFVFSLLLSITSVSVDAQRQANRLRERVQQGEISKSELIDIRRDRLRYEAIERKARENGELTPTERKKLLKKKAESRREAWRKRHNRSTRVI